MAEVTDAMVERVARYMCRRGGKDPDRMIRRQSGIMPDGRVFQELGVPIWRQRVRAAREIIEVALNG